MACFQMSLYSFVRRSWLIQTKRNRWNLFLKTIQRSKATARWRRTIMCFTKRSQARTSQTKLLCAPIDVIVAVRLNWERKHKKQIGFDSVTIIITFMKHHTRQAHQAAADEWDCWISVQLYWRHSILRVSWAENRQAQKKHNSSCAKNRTKTMVNK